MNDFIFRLDSFHLTDEQRKRIAAAIQGAVTHELAALNLRSTDKAGKGEHAAPAAAGHGSFIFYPDLWNGGRMFADVALASKVINTQLIVQEKQIG